MQAHDDTTGLKGQPTPANDFADPAGAAKAAIGQKLAPEAARQRALAGPRRHAGLSVIYKLATGAWEVEMLKECSDMTIVTNTRQLEAAMADTDVSTILIARPAAVTLKHAMEICDRAGLGKTVFFEE